MKLAILSDTHGLLRPAVLAHLTAADAILHSVTNIMIRQPANCATALMMDGRLLESACCSVLTSLVTRLRISP